MRTTWIQSGFDPDNLASVNAPKALHSDESVKLIVMNSTASHGLGTNSGECVEVSIMVEFRVQLKRFNNHIFAKLERV